MAHRYGPAAPTASEFPPYPRNLLTSSTKLPGVAARHHRRRYWGPLLHRGDYFRGRHQLAEQGRRPGNGHEPVEGHIDAEQQNDHVGNDQLPVLPPFQPHEDD